MSFPLRDAPIKDLSIESRNNQLIYKASSIRREIYHLKPLELSLRIRLVIFVSTPITQGRASAVKRPVGFAGASTWRALVNTNGSHGITIEKRPDPQILTKFFLPRHILAKSRRCTFRVATSLQFRRTPVPELRRPTTRQLHSLSSRRYALRQTHHGTTPDLIMIDMDPRDPFDFYLDHYQKQLVSGYSKSTLEFGLRAHVRDYNKLASPSSAAPAQKMNPRLWSNFSVLTTNDLPHRHAASL